MTIEHRLHAAITHDPRSQISQERDHWKANGEKNELEEEFELYKQHKFPEILGKREARI
jgi:hypothetical protein